MGKAGKQAQKTVKQAQRTIKQAPKEARKTVRSVPESCDENSAIANLPFCDVCWLRRRSRAGWWKDEASGPSGGGASSW